MSDLGGGALVSVLDVQSLFPLLKEIGFVPWPDFILNQTLVYYWQEIFFFDSDIRQWSHPSMIPLHCLWAKSNNKTHGQFESVAA